MLNKANMVITHALEALGIKPNASKMVLEPATTLSLEDCVRLEGGDLLTDLVGRQIGTSGFLKVVTPVNWDAKLGIHTIDAVKVTGSRPLPATFFRAFGAQPPTKAKKAPSLGRRKAAEQAWIPNDYLIPGQPTMFDILSYVVTEDGVVLMAVPNEVTEVWPTVVQQSNRRALAK